MITLYSTNCPKCNVLEKKLKDKSMDFELVTDFDTKELIRKGFLSAPVLKVDDKYMDFVEANKWLQTQGN